MHILLIAADAADRASLAALLPGTVEAIPDASTGLALLAQGSFDCVVADLQAAAAVVGRGDVPVVVVVDDAAEGSVVVGAADWLVRGSDQELVSRVVTFAVERHHLRSELEDARARLERLERIDPLTELLNRRGAEEMLARLARRSARAEADSVALLIDVDDFKRINETRGYTAGDDALRGVARLLRVLVRPTDVVARIGGDEFLALLPETSQTDAARIAERLRHRIGVTELDTCVGPVSVTVSIGLGVLEEGATTMADVFGRVERGLRKSKLAGKDRVAWTPPSREEEEGGGEVLDFPTPPPGDDAG